MSRLSYAAHTRAATFYLDEEGICQEVSPTDDSSVPAAIMRCVGAQYVASLDLSEPTGLTSVPRSGASLLFVVADAHMKFSLMRTPPIERFETLAALEEDDIVDDVEDVSPEAGVLQLVEDDAEDEEEAEIESIESIEDAAQRVNVAWPSADVLALALPVPPSTFQLTAPPRPSRRAAS